MNPFDHITETLSAHGQRRAARPAGPGRATDRLNKTQALRDYLRDTGPATAVVLAETVGLDRVPLVSALLVKDLILGRITREGPVYHYNHQYEESVRTREEELARRLRLSGWKITPPDTGKGHQELFTETITWCDVVQGGQMPDAFILVLLNLEEGYETVCSGNWDGERWCDSYGWPLDERVIAWANMPGGRRQASE